MAINTRSRRASVLGIVAPYVLTLPLADGTVGQPDRQHVAFTYPGIQAAADVIPTELEDFTTILGYHAAALYVATPDDLNTLLVQEVPTMRSAAGSDQRDLNTDWAKYLS